MKREERARNACRTPQLPPRTWGWISCRRRRWSLHDACLLPFQTSNRNRSMRLREAAINLVWLIGRLVCLTGCLAVHKVHCRRSVQNANGAAPEGGVCVNHWVDGHFNDYNLCTKAQNGHSRSLVPGRSCRHSLSWRPWIAKNAFVPRPS